MGAACAWHHAAGRADLGLVLMVASLLSTNAATLEDIAMSAGTDKARDEHGFVAAYAMLFEPSNGYQPFVQKHVPRATMKHIGPLDQIS